MRTLVVLLLIASCSKEKDPAAPATPPQSATPTATETAPGATASAEATRPGTTDSASAEPAPPMPAGPPLDHPVVGKPAPDFTLKDLDGKEVSLASFKGKTVVLEWFNPGCPFVKRSHTVGSLVDTAQRHTAKGVVWLAINSGGPGKQGADADANRDAVKTWKLAHPVLLDPTGATGKAYGATNTPHMFVIDAKGNVVYGGAIDNSPDAERKSPEGGTLRHYVDLALEDLAAGRPVMMPVTKAYGCSVKYAS